MTINHATKTAPSETATPVRIVSVDLTFNQILTLVARVVAALILISIPLWLILEIILSALRG